MTFTIQTDLGEDTTLSYVINYSGKKAMLPQADLIAKIVGHTSWMYDSSEFCLESINDQYCPEGVTRNYEWLYANTSDSYWTDMAHDTDSALYIVSTGRMSYMGQADATYGIRPVVRVSK